MPDFVWLANAIRSWPNLPAPTTLSWTAGCQRRLWDALSIRTKGGIQVGPRDLAALTRQVLRREEVREGNRASLDVSADSPWPSRAEWEDSGCSVTEVGSRRLVQAHPWQPVWLPNAGTEAPDEAAVGERERRAYNPLPGDGFLSEIGFKHYSAPGQRQALRAVLASQPGTTILVNLPTGTGKSAVGHVPAVLWAAPAGVSVFVVPTTALALDQERAAYRYPGGDHLSAAPFAYHEGLSAAQREAVRLAIRTGTQRFLFTSPESVVGSLSPALFDAARAGFLRLFVIDEAHLVSQWGAEFRPEFQAIAGVRRALLRAAQDTGADGFRTLLLTATLTDDSLAALHSLFGDPGPFEHISAVTLRPEPSYWIAHCGDEQQRKLRLLEAVANLPRPMVVYVATQEKVAEYAQLLSARGLRRVATVSGATSAADRLRVIRSWRGEAPDADGVQRTLVDVVVATSAFGLGVDQTDVRTVLHACVPETIDRFYQEVGRGGRDGRACVSLLLWTDDDRKVAKVLNQRRIIGAEKGFDRWKSMHHGRQIVDVGRNVLRVPLDARPSHVMSESDENRAWNLRTLALMSRAGLIALDAESPPSRSSSESEEEWETRCEEAFTQYRNASVVHLLNLRAGEEAVWDAACADARRRAHQFDHAQLEAMERLLIADAPAICDMLQNVYRINWTHDDRTIEVVPERSCGGCPACRRRGSQPWEGVRPSPPPLCHPQAAVGASLQSTLAGAGTLWVFVPPHVESTVWRRDAVRLVEVLVRQGVRNIVAEPSLLADPKVQRSYRSARGRFVFLHGFEDEFTMPDLPTLWLEPQHGRSRVPHEVLRRGTSARPWVVVASENSLDPEHSTALASQLRTPQLSLQKLFKRI